jgi:hypothetical protein
MVPKTKTVPILPLRVKFHARSNTRITNGRKDLRLAAKALTKAGDAASMSGRRAQLRAEGLDAVW